MGVFGKIGGIYNRVMHGDEQTRALAQLERARQQALKRGEDPDKSAYCRTLEAKVARFDAKPDAAMR